MSELFWLVIVEDVEELLNLIFWVYELIWELGIKFLVVMVMIEFVKENI